jgi:hypothetical protein
MSRPFRWTADRPTRISLPRDFALNAGRDSSSTARRNVVPACRGRQELLIAVRQFFTPFFQISLQSEEQRV